MTFPSEQPGGSSAPLVVVHGGVDMEPDEATFSALDAAAARAAARLLSGADGLDAAVAALAVLEDDPAFNAGFGSVLTAEGRVETDGAVAVGRGRGFAGVGAVPGIRNPAAVARRLLDEGSAVLLAGDAARRFAADRGFGVEDLATEEQRLALAAADEGRSVFTGRVTAPARVPTETIGCIAVDAAGDGFAASSTGGLRGKPAGRIGDAAIPGAGYWADERVAVLCSGAGEISMRMMLAWRVAERARLDGPAAAAAWGVREAVAEHGATIAVLAVDIPGREAGAAHHGASFPVLARRGDVVRRVASTPIPTAEGR